MMRIFSITEILDAVGDGAHERGWNRNQQTVKHDRFGGSTCGRVLKITNFGERQAAQLFYPIA